jgi:hypothetical protein
MKKVTTEAGAAAGDEVFLVSRVPAALRHQVKRHAVDHCTTMQQVIVQALGDFLQVAQERTVGGYDDAAHR